MARAQKRLDLQFGSFACSVQGFDDPVKPVQQVLQALQHMLEDAPEIGTAGITFDADTIEQLIGEVGRRAELDESNIEIVPGLIIVHHGGLRGSDADSGTAEADEAEVDLVLGGTGRIAAALGDQGADDESDLPEDLPEDLIDRALFAEPEEVEADDAEPAAAETSDYVNIFAPSHHAHDAEGDDPFAESEAAETEADAAHADLAASRLGGARSEPRDIFAEDDEAVSDGNVFVDAMSAGASTARSGASSRGTAPSEGGFFSAPLSSSFPSSGQRRERKREIDEAVSLRLFSGGGDGPAKARPSGPSLVVPEPEEAPDSGAADEGYTAASLAEKVGATATNDLIVSAAAWMVLIKGQSSFARKEVLEVFAAMPGEHDNSLQARIKGFGKAVRNGQLVQIAEGDFGLSRAELTRFEKVL